MVKIIAVAFTAAVSGQLEETRIRKIKLLQEYNQVNERVRDQQEIQEMSFKENISQN